MSTDERAIRDLVAVWHSATPKGNVDTVLSLMAEDVVFLMSAVGYECAKYGRPGSRSA